jgi:hypothetical protein
MNDKYIKTVTFLLSMFCFISYGQTTINDDDKKIIVDKSNIAILPYDSTYFSHSKNFKNCKQATLTKNDYLLIEKLLMQCIAEYNVKQEELFNEISNKHPDYNLNKKHFVIDLKPYKRQYIVVTNNQNEKEVWINCFCSVDRFDNIGWRRKIIFVKDGGNCYFNLKINLTSEKYYDFWVNGDA